MWVSGLERRIPLTVASDGCVVPQDLGVRGTLRSGAQGFAGRTANK